MFASPGAVVHVWLYRPSVEQHVALRAELPTRLDVLGFRATVGNPEVARHVRHMTPLSIGVGGAFALPVAVEEDGLAFLAAPPIRLRIRLSSSEHQLKVEVGFLVPAAICRAEALGRGRAVVVERLALPATAQLVDRN